MATEPDPLGAETLFFLVGKSGVGKTALAVELAERAGAEICSLDSMQVYRGMDIGTAKPDPALCERVRHHGIDLVDPPQRFDASRYVAEARRALTLARSRGRRLLFCGGTGLYLRVLCSGLFEGPPVDHELRAQLNARAAAEGGAVLLAELRAWDPLSAERIHPNDTKRLVRAIEVWHQTGRPLSTLQKEWGRQPTGEFGPASRDVRIVGLERDDEDLERRLRERTRAMLAAGWIGEALAIEVGAGFGPTSIQALGYREILAFGAGQLTRVELEERIVLRTRQFTRRQGTWFRKFPVRWTDPRRSVALDELRAGLGWCG